MTPERWRRVQEVLDLALERPEAERAAFVLEASAGDPQLAREVGSLLAQHRPDSFLEPLTDAAESAEARADRPEAESLEGRDVGVYRVLREVGRGGMGVVYEALQRRPVERRVALKIVKWGMDTRQVIARFESERQALALMNHPSIATVYDAGATERGRPWFAMEYVSGVPITEYCDVHRLSLAKRLELFTRVCDAIQHAHQKGIIHRDVKPPNVLVTLKDGSPLPKVIDFGVAKATAQRLTEKTFFTELGQLIGTPSYMSPEQAEMTGLDIDTRSDVYSLGALLYELLAGSQPFDSTELRRAGIEEIRRRIREEDPALPSARVLASAKGGECARLRGLADARALSRELRGDLDWIVARALAKNRTERYATASELGEDVARHARHEPVRASPPSARYRIGKFVKRYRAGVVSGAIAALALAVGVAGTLVGLVRAREAEREARQEAAKAEAVSGFLKQTLGAANAESGLGPDATVLEALEGAVEQVDHAFPEQPLIEAEVRHTIGETYVSLGRPDEAEEQLQKALATRERLLGPDHEDIAATLNELGVLYESHRDDVEKGLEFHRRSLDMHLEVKGEDYPETVVNYVNVGGALGRLGDLEEGAAHVRRGMVLSDRHLGRSHHYSLKARATLGLLLRRLGRDEEAEAIYRETLALLAARPQPLLGVEALVLNNLGRLIEMRGDTDEALVLFQRAVARAIEGQGERHYLAAYYRSNYGGLLSDLGRHEEAERELLPAVGVLRETMGDDHNATQRALQRVVDLYEAWDRPAEAARYRALLNAPPPDAREPDR